MGGRHSTGPEDQAWQFRVMTATQKSSYDKFPVIPMPASCADECWRGWDDVIRELDRRVRETTGPVCLAVECYSGVFDDDLRQRLSSAWPQALVIDTKTLFRSPREIDQLMSPDLGGDDPIFGHLTRLRMGDLLDSEKFPAGHQAIREHTSGPAFIVGPGASLVAPEAALLVYADMPRWEGQLRQRRGEVDNLAVRNRGTKAFLQYKRAFFIDWRICDWLKRQTMPRWDYLLDTTDHAAPRLITGRAHLDALRHASCRPFRTVPFFDPGPWGGQWMRRVCDLPDGPPNYAWCFDGVPEENSLLLGFTAGTVEIPALNLVFFQPRELLGEAVYGRFGAEFPIRFDFLDTMGGGNLSFQVHPLTEYAREHFGLSYTQDESYYILDAEPGAEVYLGCKNGTRPEEMIADLQEAQAGNKLFDDGKFAARFPAQKHDHFLIPAGTLHCSGAGSMVLEISATPYIFTFKLWDWNRLGLDGQPRPVNIERGKAVIQWHRDEEYARRRLVNQFQEVGRGPGWVEERTGLHEAEFIETRRHWFTAPVLHQRSGSVEILNLIEGEAAIVESPEGRFAPFVVHYAETFILPDAAGNYTIRPLKPEAACATIKAFVRTKA
jgi:mannose-6-phosphate isomerase class I